MVTTLDGTLFKRVLSLRVLKVQESLRKPCRGACTKDEPNI